MHLTNHYRKFLILGILLKVSILPCFRAAFDCEEGHGRTVTGIRVLVSCTLTDNMDIIQTVGWAKNTEWIGDCETNPIRCSPYNSYGERLYFGSCGLSCFNLGIKQPMSSYYFGKYYITTDTYPVVRQLALNLNESHPYIQSVESTTRIPKTTIEDSPSSLDTYGTTFGLEYNITSKVTPQISKVSKHSTLRSWSFLETSTVPTYLTLTDSSPIDSRRKEDNFVAHGKALICVAFFCIAPIYIYLVGRKVKQFRKKHVQNNKNLSQLSNRINGKRQPVLERGSVELFEVAIQPKSSNHGTQRPLKNRGLYQALHQGPLVPLRTYLQGETNQQDDSLTSGCHKLISSGGDTLVMMGEDVQQRPLTLSDFGTLQKREKGDLLGDKEEEFEDYDGYTSMRLQVNEKEYMYQDVGDLHDRGSAGSYPTVTIPEQHYEQLPYMQVFGNPEESRNPNVHYEMSIFCDESNNDL